MNDGDARAQCDVTFNERGKLDIDIYDDLAERLPEASDSSVPQVKVVTGAGLEPATFRF